MKRNDIIASIYTTLPQLARNIGVKDNDIDDFVQEVSLILLTYDEQKLNELHSNNQLKFWVVRTMLNMYNSRTSRYYYLYKKYYERVDSNIDPFELQEKISNNYDKLDRDED